MTIRKQTTYTDDSGRIISLGKELGRGGQGAIFQIVDQPEMVAKIYFTPPDPQLARKLQILVEANEAPLQKISAWPTCTIRNEEAQVCGFVMPLVSDREYHELHNLYRPASRQHIFPEADWRFMVHVARNIARAFVVLHGRHYLMGDVSSRNVMVSPTGVIQLIDIDSFQVKHKSAVFPCLVATAEFTPPELQGQHSAPLIRSENHDLFGLALLIFHLLFEGRHPYAGIHDNGATPSPAEAIAADKFAYSLRARSTVKPPLGAMSLGQLHPDVRKLFEQAFSSSHSRRPSAAEWEKVLGDLLPFVQPCAHNAAHVHDKRLPCPWCVLEATTAHAPTVDTSTRMKRYKAATELTRLEGLLQAIAVPPPAISNQHVPRLTPPQPLPDMPIAPAVEAHFLSGAALWGAIYAAAFVFALFNAWSWHYWLSFFILAASEGAKNAPQNLRKRRLANELKSRRIQLTSYKGLLEEHQQQLAIELERIKLILSDTYKLQQAESANHKYFTALGNLAGMRQQLLLLEQIEPRELQRVIDQARETELARYLAAQKVDSRELSGFHILAINQLRKNNILTANDIGPHISQIKGLKPKRQQALLEWRATLEQFFFFDESSIPKSHFDEVRRQLDERKRQKVAEMEAAIRRLADDIQLWQAHEVTIDKEIRKLQQTIYGLENSIQYAQDAIDKLEIT